MLQGESIACKHSRKEKETEKGKCKNAEMQKCRNEKLKNRKMILVIKHKDMQVIFVVPYNRLYLQKY